MTEQNAIKRFFLRLFWFNGPAVTLLVRGDTTEIVQWLQEGAKPSKDRLHLQDVFTGGRRYLIEKRREGFAILTTSKHYWRYIEGTVTIRRRTRAASRVVGTITDLDSGYTRIHLQGHIRLGYLLDVIWIPAFFTSIVVFMPWPVPVIGGIALLLFALSYAYHWYNAAYQSNEIMFFVERVLQPHLVTNLPTLASTADDVMRVHEDFKQEWERFYSDLQGRD